MVTGGVAIPEEMKKEEVSFTGRFHLFNFSTDKYTTPNKLPQHSLIPSLVAIPHSVPRETIWDMALEQFVTHTMECIPVFTHMYVD